MCIMNLENQQILWKYLHFTRNKTILNTLVIDEQLMTALKCKIGKNGQKLYGRFWMNADTYKRQYDGEFL